MKSESIKFTVTEKNYGLVELYEAVAKEMGYLIPDKLRYDCREINVAPNIQDGFYAHYMELIKAEDPHVSEHEARCQITILLAMSGPKVDKSLKANEVEVFEGFIID